MFLPSKFKFKYIGWFLAVLLVSPAFKDIFVYFFVVTARNTQLSYRRGVETDKVREENARLKLEAGRFAHLEEENARLKKALAIREKSDLKLVYAPIIGFSPSVWRRIAYISVGSSNDVSRDDLVIDENGRLVGKVLEAKDNFSEVVLLSDPYFSLPVFIRDKGMGLLKGMLGGELRILYVEENQGVEAGDRVNALNRQAGFPIEIGTVRQAKISGDDFFLDVRVKPSADIQSARNVFVVK